MLQAPIVKTIPFSWVDGPGNRFVIFTQGCNFNCIACHNPQTIPLHTSRAVDRSVESLLEEIRGAMPFITGVTVSGGEATLHIDFIKDLFTRIKTDPQLAKLTCFVDSNGNTIQSDWEKILPVSDGVMVDLKVLDDEKHVTLTGSTNTLVLDSIKYLHNQNRLFEVRLLLVPGQNDSDEDLRNTAAWLIDVDPEINVRINAFKGHGTRASTRDWPDASETDVARYFEVLTACGIRNIVSSTPHNPKT